MRAIEAGADQVLVSHSTTVTTAAIEEVIAAVREYRLPDPRIDTAVKRIL